MKIKTNVILTIGVAATVLLIPSFADAQKGKKSKSKPKPFIAKTKNSTAASGRNDSGQTANQTVSTGEPTEVEMKEAVVRMMVRKGANDRSDDAVSVDNMLSGLNIKIEDFEKLGCQRANYDAGYFCTYEKITSLTLYSNEGTTAGNNRARG